MNQTTHRRIWVGKQTGCISKTAHQQCCCISLFRSGWKARHQAVILHKNLTWHARWKQLVIILTCRSKRMTELENTRVSNSISAAQQEWAWHLWGRLERQEVTSPLWQRLLYWSHDIEWNDRPTQREWQESKGYFLPSWHLHCTQQKLQHKASYFRLFSCQLLKWQKEKKEKCLVMLTYRAVLILSTNNKTREGLVEKEILETKRDDILCLAASCNNATLRRVVSL